MAHKSGFGLTTNGELNDTTVSYDKKLGLKIHLEKLENDISTKSKQLQSIQLQEKDFKTKHEDSLNTLQILKNLKLQGIGDASILEWSKIFESSKLSIAEFYISCDLYAKIVFAFRHIPRSSSQFFAI